MSTRSCHLRHGAPGEKGAVPPPANWHDLVTGGSAGGGDRTESRMEEHPFRESTPGPEFFLVSEFWVKCRLKRRRW